MATPGAIAVYTAGSGIPENQNERPWRGIYHHYDAQPSGLGAHLIQRVKQARGDLQQVVSFLIDSSPRGWSCCFEATNENAEEYLQNSDTTFPVSPQDTSQIAYIYIFDLSARRLDAFLASGKRLGSVSFAEGGVPDIAALDLSPLELSVEQGLPGSYLELEEAKQTLRELSDWSNSEVSLQWVSVEEDSHGGLEITFRAILWEQGSINSIVERSWCLIPQVTRSEPQRIKNFFSALGQLVKEQPEALEPFWMESIDSFRRTQVRSQELFYRILKESAENYLAALAEG